MNLFTHLNNHGVDLLQRRNGNDCCRRTAIDCFHQALCAIDLIVDCRECHVQLNIEELDISQTDDLQHAPNGNFIFWHALTISSITQWNKHNYSRSSDMDSHVIQVDISFLSMICHFNLGQCYLYEGIMTKSNVILQESIQYYVRAHRDMVQSFHLQDKIQCITLLGILNNMAITYQYQNDYLRFEVCNRQLLSTLVLLTYEGHFLEDGYDDHDDRACDDNYEQDGNVTSPNISGIIEVNYTNIPKIRPGALARHQKRTSIRGFFDKFLCNVYYLILPNSPSPASAA